MWRCIIGAGAPQIVEVLLEHGASTSVVNRRRQTPADVCRSPVIRGLLDRATREQGGGGGGRGYVG